MQQIRKKMNLVEYKIQSKKIETVKIESQETFFSVTNPNKKKQGIISVLLKKKASNKSQVLILLSPFLK